MSDAASLCPSASELRVAVVAVAGDQITITAQARRATVDCPLCGHASARIHSHYRRTLADLPWQGRRVALIVTTRRFFCDHAACARRIFTEPLPGTARRTARAATLLEALGFALGGRAAARVAERLGTSAAPNTVLAGVRRARMPTVGAVRVLGVDDWGATCKVARWIVARSLTIERRDLPSHRQFPTRYGGAATRRREPSDNVPGTYGSAPRPRGRGVTASIRRWRGQGGIGW